MASRLTPTNPVDENWLTFPCGGGGGVLVGGPPPLPRPLPPLLPLFICRLISAYKTPANHIIIIIIMFVYCTGMTSSKLALHNRNLITWLHDYIVVLFYLYVSISVCVGLCIYNLLYLSSILCCNSRNYENNTERYIISGWETTKVKNYDNMKWLMAVFKQLV